MREILEIVCYGAGAGFRDFSSQLNQDVAKIVGVIDKSISKRDNYCVISLEMLHRISYDYVVICSRKYRDEMSKNLRDHGVPNEKIVLAFSCVGVDASHVHGDLMQTMTGVACFTGSYACAILIGKMMIVYLEGSLDVSNAKETEEEVLAFLSESEARHMLIDAEQLTNLTPKGLRCLLHLNSGQ